MLTIIVPSYNQGQYIQYTLDSIMANLGPQDQLIIADGASTDATKTVVTPYLADPRVEWYSEPDRGFSDAMTKALARVKNPIIGIMSSDDAYLPGVRNRAMALFQDPHVLLVYADYEIIDTDNNRIGAMRHKDGTLADLLSLRVILPQSSVFFRRSALDGQSILNLQHDYVADVVLLNQVCMAGKFLFVPEIWSQVRKHGGSRSGTRDPGAQYLHAIDTAFGALPTALRNHACAGAHLLQARHQAYCGQRIRAAQTLLSALAQDRTLLNHWLLLRTLAYIVLGARGIRGLQWIRRTCYR